MAEREISTQELDARGRGRGRDDWVMEIESQVENNKILKTRETDVWKKHTIYKIPEVFISDDKRKQAYTPQVVSIGPYHHGKKQLLAMEEHKLRALRHFLVRTQKGIREYRDALRGVVQELMDSYKDLEKEWKDDEERFLQLMIFDGCFMIELWRYCTEETNRSDYVDNDPIFSRHGWFSNVPRIQRDMLMIENQIPLLVLKTLLCVHDSRFEEDKQVNKLVRAFFAAGAEDTSHQEDLGLHVLDVVRKSMIRVTGYERERPDQNCGWVDLGLHVLDVVWKSMIRVIGYKRKEPDQNRTMKVIWPATRLRDAGIEFETSKSTSLKDVKFDIQWKCDVILRKGILRLPQIDVHDATESKLLNLIAFEHLHAGAGKEVSSYAAFMDSIIDSDEDAILLSESNIINNLVGTDQAVADLFNGLSHDISLDPHSDIGVVHQKVTKHCAQPCYKHLANLKHTYCKSPWAGIAFVAAAIGLCLTITQFAYATKRFIEKN